MIKILYLCDRPLGIKCLEWLLASRYQICGVVSRSDNENNWWGKSVFQEFCRTNGLMWFDHSLKLTSIVEKCQPDIVLSVLYTKIVPKNIIEKVKCFNLHCAPLPEYKGYNSTLQAIINNEKYFGATLHEMTEQPDSGNVIDKGNFEIPRNITNIELYNMTQKNAYEIFCKNIDSIIFGKYKSIPQKGAGHFYKKDEIPSRELSLNWNEEKIHTFARAFYFPPFEPAYVVIEDQKIKLIPEINSV